ncbi:MAG: Coenzyme F420 hydrogenase/dehydrogenase, beta subunit C-terminal domain [Armatimonadota bacterium]|jgi:formate dehydrogenase subunit beta
MTEIQDKIREEAKKALESGEVGVVIGWGAGTVPFKTTPVFIDKAEDVEKLVWNPACTNNLAVYLTKWARNGKVGIVAKPCDVRSIVTLIREKQVKRENVFIIGLGCGGVVDASLIESGDVRMQEVTSLEWDDDDLMVTTQTTKVKVPAAEALRQQCKVCEDRTPSLSDVTIGEAVAPSEGLKLDLPGLSEDRQKYWQEQFSRCIRCYACRQVCPACYCDTCFCDRIEPKWTAKKATTDEAWMFHATRAMHLVGRCIGCGECERVCPVGIPAVELARELNAVAKERYDFDPGDPQAEKPLLGTYKDNDVDPAHHSE